MRKGLMGTQGCPWVLWVRVGTCMEMGGHLKVSQCPGGHPGVSGCHALLHGCRGASE